MLAMALVPVSAQLIGMVSHVGVTPTRGARSVRELTNELTERQLRSVGLFGGCTSADLAKVARSSIERRVAVGEVIVSAGTVAAEVTILLDGYAGAEVEGESALVLGPGAVIGGPEALDGALHPMTVVAQTPMVVRVMSASVFQVLIESVPKLAIALIRQLGGRTRTVLNELACARQGSVTSIPGSPPSGSPRVSSRPVRSALD